MTRESDRMADVLESMFKGEYNAPRDRRPRLETYVSNGYYGIVVQAPDTDRCDGEWIHAEQPMQVEQ